MESDPTNRPLMDYRWDSPLYVNSKCPKRERNPILPFRYSERTRRREGELEKSLETWSKFYMRRLREIPSPSYVMHNKARQASLITSLVTFITRETSAISVWIWGKLYNCKGHYKFFIIETMDLSSIHSVLPKRVVCGALRPVGDDEALGQVLLDHFQHRPRVGHACGDQ